MSLCDRAKMSPMADHLDHVVICVPDLAEASRRYEIEHGLVSVEGGRHQGHGTANRLIPLGDWYIELLAVVDPDEAKTSALGTWTAHRSARPGADGVCLRPDDFDDRVSQLSLTPTEMTRVTPEGHLLRWRLAGLKHTVSAGLPFFIDWDVPPDMHPASISTGNGQRLPNASVVVYSEDDRLEKWLSASGPTVRSGVGPARVELGLS